MIDHPSYKTNTGCVEDDVSVAIGRSLMMGGQSVGTTYSETAARLLAADCDWESDDEYAYRGSSDDGRTWRVHLVEGC